MILNDSRSGPGAFFGLDVNIAFWISLSVTSIQGSSLGAVSAPWPNYLRGLGVHGFDECIAFAIKVDLWPRV